jgi:hypothetical protein
MKHLLPRLFASLILITACFWAYVSFSGDIRLRPGTNHMELVVNTSQHLQIRNEFTLFSFEEVKTPEGTFTRIKVPKFNEGGEFGQPSLPVDSRLIELPAGAGFNILISAMEVREYSLAELGIVSPVYPSQPPLPKTGEPANFAFDPAAYLLDRYFGQEPVSVEPLGILRGVRIGRLDISPVQYNPATQTLRIYERIEFEIVFTGGDLAQTEYLKRTYSDHYFQPVFNNLLNYREPASSSRDTLSRYPIKYVIVSDPMFEDQLQPFIEWKRLKGFDVVEAYTDDPGVGTTTYQIKAYLQALYDNATPEAPAPTFVLFVGDIDQVPTWNGIAAGHVTDLYYVEYTGDYFPEIYYGRFSAQNTAQLQPQIDKTLMYEQFTMPDPSYLEEAVMIAGMDGTFGPVHGNGQINYGTLNYFNEDHGILSHTYLYPESGSNSASIRQNISDGVFLANYTAHGSPSGWADPAFTVNQIPALENEGKYGLLVGNCCSTSEYQVGECFGEALLRAENKGAVGYIGASNSTYWDEDYYFGVGVGVIAGNPPAYEETTLGYYDRAFHDHGEPYADWYMTMDQMIFAGNLAVTLGSSGMAMYYWEAYCLMGDPSLMVYLGMPSTMEVSYDPMVPVGSSSFTVMAVPYAYVALSLNGDLLGAALADSTGEAVIPLSGATMPGMADVVATAQQYQPFLGTVLIANPEGPYVLLNEFEQDDSAGGNNNGVADAGETILLDTELKNWGNSDALDVTATLILIDSLWVEVNDDFEEFGEILSQDSLMKEAAYAYQVADSIPDMAQVQFELSIEDGSRETWSSGFSITLHAPVLHIGGLTLVDTPGGNGNGRLDPGETVDVFLQTGNIGHCDAYNALVTMATASEFLTLNVDSSMMDTLSWGSMYPMPFNLTVSDDALPGSYASLSFNASASPYSCQKEIILPIGMIIEDFESGDFTSFGWMFGGDQPWTITSDETFEGAYSAESGNIDDLQTSVLYLDADVASADSISFYLKVSCEDDPNNDYDWLAFFIDEDEMGRWDGETGWLRVSYPVTEGSHTFRWVYRKDYSVASGEDAAWIDFIVLPGVSQNVSVHQPVGKQGVTSSVYPNPAGTAATLSFTLGRPSDVSVSVLDLSGRQVSIPQQGIKLDAGFHSLNLDLETLPAGAYFVVLKYQQGTSVSKLIRK